MFESLHDGLTSALKTLRGKGKLTVANMRDGLGLVEQSLLEADVSYSVVQDFMGRVTEQALGQRVLNSLNPSEQLVGVVHDELVGTADSERLQLCNRLFDVGKRMPPGPGLDRSREIDVEVEIHGPRYVRFLVLPVPGLRICQFEARVYEDPFGIANTGLEHFRDSDYVIVRHNASHPPKVRQTLLYNDWQFWTIAFPRAPARFFQADQGASSGQDHCRPETSY